MTPEAEQGQDAMLERLAKKHRLEVDYEADKPGWAGVRTPDNVLAFGRELLQAVQERDAALSEAQMGECTSRPNCHLRDAHLIRSQTYADLFMEEK